MYIEFHRKRLITSSKKILFTAFMTHSITSAAVHYNQQLTTNLNAINHLKLEGYSTGLFELNISLSWAITWKYTAYTVELWTAGETDKTHYHNYMY